MQTFVFFFNAVQFKKINFLINRKTVGFKRINNSLKLYSFKVHLYESKIRTPALHTTKSPCI